MYDGTYYVPIPMLCDYDDDDKRMEEVGIQEKEEVNYRPEDDKQEMKKKKK